MSSGITATAATGGELPADPTPERHGATESSSSWSLLDRTGLALAWFLGILFCLIALAIIVYVAVQGIHYLRPSLIWTNPRVSTSESESGGFLAEEIGTLLACGIGLALAAPIGVGIAVWLSEYNRPRVLARVIESTVEMLAGAPSVVLALFGLILFDSRFLAFLSQTNGGVVFGYSFFAAGAMLALLGLPLVVSTVREGLQAIPNHVREASYAVGKSKSTTIRRILLPAARPSVITGSMLSFGHMLGDTAIILLLLGDTQSLQGVGHVPLLGILRGTGSTMTSYIFDNAPTGDLNQTGKAFAAAFVLLIGVLALNLLVDIYSRRARDLRWS